MRLLASASLRDHPSLFVVTLSNPLVYPRKGVRTPMIHTEMAQSPTVIGLVGSIENSLPSAAGGQPSTWPCHRHNESCQVGAEECVHAKEMHQDSTEATGSEDEIKTKKKPYLQSV